jgi:hypothetical protein
MSEEYFPYNKIISEMQKRADNCDIKIIDSLRYFLRQSQGEYGPSQAVTLSDETIKKIDDILYKFKEKCYCGDSNSIIWGDDSTYIEQDSHAEKEI